MTAKRLPVSLLLVVLAAPAAAAAPIRVSTQDPATIVAIAQAIRNAPEFFRKGVQAAEMTGRRFHGALQRLWCCRYADGTVVFNKRRAYAGRQGRARVIPEPAR